MSDQPNQEQNNQTMKRPLHGEYTAAEADSVMTIMFMGNTATIHNIFRAEVDPFQMLAASKLIEKIALDEITKLMKLNEEVRSPGHIEVPKAGSFVG